MMYYILRKLKKHAKSAAKQIPERDVYPLANKYRVIQLFQVSSSLGEKLSFSLNQGYFKAPNNPPVSFCSFAKNHLKPYINPRGKH